MARTTFSGPVNSKNGFEVNGTEVINSSGEYVGGIDAPAGSIGTTELADNAVTVDKIGTQSVEAGRSTGVPFTRTVVVSQDQFDGTAQTLFELPAPCIVTDLRMFTTDGVGSTATIDVGTNDDSSAWVNGNNDPNGFAAAFSIENTGAYLMSSLDESNQPALAVSGALVQAEGAEIILTSAGDYTGSGTSSVIVTVTLVPINPAAFV